MAIDVIPVELMQVGPLELGIRWSDGHQSKYAVRNIRLNCHCANCVDEWTREVRVKSEHIPADIKPRKIESLGRYAFSITWSDGHDTGIFTFEQLRALCECEACKPR